ncbi:uncharacterized protein [Chironomus tepperi]|uniref:uncharacterized protein n=1 Tax=Chironomus tepperi TaxID=113505 RepID=UPI00391FAD59
MDILRKLNKEELEYIKFRFEEHLPKSIKNLYYIYSAEKCKAESGKYSKLSDKILPTFYIYRNGLKENCTVFGITGEENHTIWYFSFDESMSEIKKCLEQTNLIKWNSKLCFVTLHAEQIQPILHLAARKGKIIDNEENSYYYLPIERALNLKIRIPNEVNLVQLQANDAPICNRLWKYKNENSELWIKSLIMVHGGYALRDKISNELLSLAIINDHLAIGVLITVEKAQRKGYGETLVKYLAKKLSERDLIPHVYVNKKNDKGIKLFHKLGFIKIGDSNWITIL